MPRYYIPPVAEEMEFSLEDLCQNELKQIEMENRLTVLMDENISCMQAEGYLHVYMMFCILFYCTFSSVSYV